MIKVIRVAEPLSKDTRKYVIFLNDANKQLDFYQFIYVLGKPMEATETQTGTPWESL